MSEVNLDTGVMDDGNSVRIIAELGAQAVKPRELKEGQVYALPDGKGGYIIERAEDEPAHPVRVKATRTVTDAASFIAYVTRHGGDRTEVWADLKKSEIVAIIDAHADSTTEFPEDRASYESHKLILKLEHTPSWLSWAEQNKQRLNQEAFAEHIEENLLDVLEPDAATMLEIAQTFHATRGVDFGQSTRLSTGETQIKYSEALDGKAGRNGDLTIPEEVVLGLVPYIGGTGYKVTAKLRWRLNNANLSLSYILVKPEDILEKAFTDVLETIKEGIEHPVFAGRP